MAFGYEVSVTLADIAFYNAVNGVAKPQFVSENKGSKQLRNSIQMLLTLRFVRWKQLKLKVVPTKR
jgi:hypothetical protein